MADDYRDMPAGPERDAAKTEAFRLAYSAEGEREFVQEAFEVKRTVTGRFVTHHPPPDEWIRQLGTLTIPPEFMEHCRDHWLLNRPPDCPWCN